MATKSKSAAARRRVKKREASKPEFVLKFDGKPDEISAATFLESLAGVTSVVQEANREFGSGQPLDIKIRAPRPGSFLVNVVLDPALTEHVANLFTVGAGLVSTLTTAIGIWRFLKGKRPKSVEPVGDGTVTIQNDSGNVIIQDQKIANFVLNNSTVTFNLSRTFGALDGDPNVTAFQVLDSKTGDKLADVPRDEFPQLAVTPSPVGDQKRDMTVRTRLTIVKPSFDKALRWEFVYSGNRIGAIVSDAVFNTSIDDGKKFGKGETLDVSLRIKQEYDAALKAFMNRGYEVIAVHAHIALAVQEGFEFNDGR